MVVFVKLSENRLKLGEMSVPIVSGKAGYVPYLGGREGDNKTPLGEYHLRFGLYRADRLLKPPPAHPKNPVIFHPLRPDDGWCDDPQDPAYNRFIKRPYKASHEALWRDDGAYDIILVISHNDSPPQSGLGSAIFMHIAQPDHRPTQGCLALAPEDILTLLPKFERDQSIIITE